MKTRFQILFLAGILSSFIGIAQNVGVGNPNPSEKLDVLGNINVTGTIKANGQDGQPGDVLMKNSSGVLAWGSLCDFKNSITFSTVGSSTWTVPAAVTRVRIEAWGGGGGSSLFCSGGGGGYITGTFDVTPGNSVNYTVGAAGNGGAPGTAGTLSLVSYNAIALIAFGGAGAPTSGSVALGGGFQGGGAGYFGMVGENGRASKFEGFPAGASTYLMSQTGGKGGDAGNAPYTGGSGVYTIRDAVTTSVTYGANGTAGRIPGGGGGGGLTWGGSVFNGAQGLVTIYY